jgi:glycosyltransferase involved in cell wall biosynthesis
MESLPVSVIVPFFESEEYLDRLSKSLAAQGAREVIVVIDDGSPESTIQRAMEDVPNLRVMRTAGRVGAGMARNRGVESATQPWLAFLDDDDWWPPGFLTELVAAAGGDVVAYDCQVWRERGGEVEPTEETVFGRAGWERPDVDVAHSDLLLSGFPLLKLLLKREAFDAVGGYRAIPAVEDFDLVWRLVAAGHRIETLPAPAGNYLVRADGVTGVTGGDLRTYERAQRGWVRIWSAMARDRRLPPPVRRACAKRTVKVLARMPARRAKHALRRIRG